LGGLKANRKTMAGKLAGRLFGVASCGLQNSAASSDQEELPDLLKNEQLYGE
jgi:hypothetical protein